MDKTAIDDLCTSLRVPPGIFTGSADSQLASAIAYADVTRREENLRKLFEQTMLSPIFRRALGTPAMLNGVEVCVSTNLCDGGRFVRWRRSHRRSRINKKWHKRYGAVLSECSGSHTYEMKGVGLVVCPHAFAKMKETAKSKEEEK